MINIQIRYIINILDFVFVRLAKDSRQVKHRLYKQEQKLNTIIFFKVILLMIDKIKKIIIKLIQIILVHYSLKFQVII